MEEYSRHCILFLETQSIIPWLLVQADEGDEAASAVSSISVAHQHPKDVGTSVGVNVDGVQSTLYICIALLILYILFPRVSDMRDNWKYR